MDTLVRRRAEADFPLRRTRGFQKDELLGRITLHKMTSFLLMIPALAGAKSPVTEKVNSGSGEPKGSRGRAESPLVASAEAKSSATMKDCLLFQTAKIDFSLILMKRAASRGLSDRPLDSFGGRLPCYLNYIGRFFSYWQGRFAACAFIDFAFGMVARKTVGALPQTPQGSSAP